MDQNAAEFLSSGYLSPKQHELLRNKGTQLSGLLKMRTERAFVVDELLAAIRPQAVPLVDSFAIPDYLINSALGRYGEPRGPPALQYLS